jgi:hypothetical protein
VTSGHAPALYDPDWLSLLDARERLKARGAEAVEAETAICLVLRDGKLKVHITIEKVTYAPTRATLSPTYVRALEFKEGSKLRLPVPFDLKPEGIDWDNSRPTRPWPYGPWQHQLLAHISRIEVSRTDLEGTFAILRAAKAAEEERGIQDLAGDLPVAVAVAISGDTAGTRSVADEPPAEAKGEAREEASPPGVADRDENMQPAGDFARTSLSDETRGDASPRSDFNREQFRRKWARRAIDEYLPNGIPPELPTKNLVNEISDFAKGKGWNVGGRDTILRAAGRRRK